MILDIKGATKRKAKKREGKITHAVCRSARKKRKERVFL